MQTVTITVLCDGKTYTITTFPNEYRNLMVLIFDKIYVEEFGECLGMGKCGTCLIEIIEMPLSLSSYDRNEETTINKAGITNKNVRLSCQILVNEMVNGLKIKVVKPAV
ncbi:ferredoxin [Pedobacter sp. P351]|uniref:ferredoxin n=1 Tax=Pedobacter superstes TaxID=3133441 RepID=UPI0030963379